MENRSEKICNRCSKVDFKSIFDPSIEIPPATGRPIKPHLDVVTAVMEASACPLCRLFAAVRFPREPPVHVPSGHYHLRAFSSLKLYALTKTKSRTALKPSVVLSVESGNPVKKDLSGGYLMSYGLIASISAVPSPAIQPFHFHGSLVDPSSVNFHVVREWLRYCKTQHTDFCEPRVSLQLASLRVINCDTMGIVQMAMLAPDLEYFALSYVWGAPNPETSIETTSFRTSLSCAQLPQVVKDAIEVVKSLREPGRRYLWIDKYCIDQNDPRDKQCQIQSMDKVYEGAFATIIAASGNGANSGLPGVGHVSRKAQPAAVVNGIQLVSTLPHISTVLKGTTWMTRGWTYQEAVLSRRCLIFTDLQVYLVCRKSTCCEAIIKASDLTAPGDELPKTLFYPRVRTGPENTSPLQLFSVQVEQYSQRVLTKETDALDAFKGILARAPFHSYCGIPILNVLGNQSLDVGFARGLDWRTGIPDKSLRRRHELPSWSWVGWAGRIVFYFGDRAGFAHFDIAIWIELSDQRLVSLRDLRDGATETKVIEEVSFKLHVKAYMVKVWFQRPSYPQRGHWTSAVFCWTHPDSECGDDKESECGNRSVQIYLGDSPDQRVFSQLWDGLLLPSGSDREDVPVLIVEWHDTIAQRIGILHAKHSVINTLPKTQETIRIE